LLDVGVVHQSGQPGGFGFELLEVPVGSEPHVSTLTKLLVPLTAPSIVGCTNVSATNERMGDQP
jgi:hypothetical protein